MQRTVCAPTPKPRLQLHFARHCMMIGTTPHHNRYGWPHSCNARTCAWGLTADTQPSLLTPAGDTGAQHYSWHPLHQRSTVHKQEAQLLPGLASHSMPLNCIFFFLPAPEPQPLYLLRHRSDASCSRDTHPWHCNVAPHLSVATGRDPKQTQSCNKPTLNTSLDKETASSEERSQRSSSCSPKWGCCQNQPA